MKFSGAASDEMILAELGRRLAQVRLGKHMTQKQLAERAGVSKRTVERLESGEVAPQLTAFVRIYRALELVERLEGLVPESGDGLPVSREAGGKERRRAARVARQDGVPPREGETGLPSQRGRPRAAVGEGVVADRAATSAAKASSVVVVAHELN
ncbi:MAG: helix-turn-helix transcriptional regulator [Verrucomicrobia bacterium]|nr:helix-turn-helix transcriptional regulator [Verrucomicrobiota bacterium]